MPDEYEIQAVMLNTDCDRDTAIKALKLARLRVPLAINRVVVLMNTPGPKCDLCGEPVAKRWSYCPCCGRKLEVFTDAQD